MKLAVSSYSYARSKISDIEIIHRAAETGFEGVEFIELFEGQDVPFAEKMAHAKEIRREADACGIVIPAYAVDGKLYHGNAEEDLAAIEHFKKEAEIAAVLGATVMRHDAVYSEFVGDRVIGFDRMLPTIAENARAVTEYAQTLGVRTCSENHGRLVQDIDRLEKLFNAVGHDNYGLLIDVGNFAAADVSSTEAVSRLAPYAIHLHVKDMEIIPYGTPYDTSRKYIMSRGASRLFPCTLGEGDIPIAHCLEIFKLGNPAYNGWLSLEYEAKKDCLEEIPKCFARMKEYTGQ